jgi:hypothetical protein
MGALIGADDGHEQSERALGGPLLALIDQQKGY